VWDEMEDPAPHNFFFVFFFFVIILAIVECAVE
jgi:hypothetical protein